jgi:hypothetical protein
MKLYDVIRKDEKEKGIRDLKPEVIDTPDSVERNEIVTKRSPKKIREEERSSWKKIAIITSIVIFITIIYVIGNVFVHATVVINEKQLPFSLQNERLSLENSTLADPGRLSFQTMVVTDSVSRQVFASAMTTSTTKATGEAVIFNQYSKGSQTVRNGTVLTGANGKKYITQSSVSVPGYTTSGKTKTPGSAKVNIVAADVGPTYNSPGTTFTIAGWTGGNAKVFFGSSAGSISGGQNGAMHTLSDTDKQRALVTLQTALAEKLSRETRAQIPATLITFPDLQFTSLDTNSLSISGDTIQFAATLKGTMVSYLISRDVLAQTIASKVDSGNTYSQVIIPALGNIQVQPVTALPVDPKNTPATISVLVTGQGVVIPQVTPEAIQQAVAGISTSSFEGAIAAIPAIQNATYSLLPFWTSHFPYKSSRIKVVIH